jgi:hypothetical protein
MTPPLTSLAVTEVHRREWRSSRDERSAVGPRHGVFRVDLAESRGVGHGELTRSARICAATKRFVRARDSPQLTMIGLSQCLAISRTISSLNERECVDVPMSTVGLTSLTTVGTSATSRDGRAAQFQHTAPSAEARSTHTSRNSRRTHQTGAPRDTDTLTPNTHSFTPPHSPSMSHNASCSGFSLGQSMTSSSGLAYASCA